MRLWGSKLSPYLMRAIYCGQIKGVEIEVYTPPFDTYSDSFRALSPLGKVPLLEDGKLLLPESMVICEYLEEILPGPSIWPDALANRLNARLLCQIADLYLMTEAINHFLPKIAPGRLEGAKERLLASFNAIEHYLDSSNVWAADDRPTAADCFLVSAMAMFDALSQPHSADDWFVDLPRLNSWWKHAKTDSFFHDGYIQQVDAFRLALPNMV